MPDTATLRTLSRATTAILFVVEGVPYVWSTHPDLDGTTYMGDGRVVLPGLERPKVTTEVPPSNHWQFRRHPATIVLQDLDGRLAEVFGQFFSAHTPLSSGIHPSEDPIADAALHGRQVGSEAIGPAGERDRWPVVDGFEHAREHVGENYESEDLALTPVSDGQVILRGRRCALIRVFRDVVDYPDEASSEEAHWRPWDEGDRFWWGTIRDEATVDGRTWAIECDGPESWLYRPLGLLTQDRPVKALAPLRLSDIDGQDETRIGIILRSFRSPPDDPTAFEYGSDNFVSQVAAVDVLGLRQDVSNALAAAVAAAGPDGAFEDEDGKEAYIDVSSGAIHLRIDNLGINEQWPQATIVLHRKVWERWGFDVDEQAARETADKYYVDFTVDPLVPGLDVPPAAGYVAGRFTTLPDPGQYGEDTSSALYDNNGAVRSWLPFYKAGAQVLDSDTSAGIVVELGNGDIVHHTGQIDRPVASDPDDPTSGYDLDGNPVDTHGYWIFYGRRRFAGTDEVFDEVQIAEASWRARPLHQHQLAGDPPAIVVTRWLDPRDFGFEHKALSSPWVALANAPGEESILARPLLRLGYRQHGFADDPAIVMLRLVLTTGQSTGWTSFENDPATSLPATANEPVLVPSVRLDGEVADLGLSIPASMVRNPLEWGNLSANLPDGLRRMSLGVLPGMAGEDLFRGLMHVNGWGWTLRGGQYGVFDPTAAVYPEVGDPVLDLSAKATSGRDISLHKILQDARVLAPVDRFILEYDWEPAADQPTREESHRSTDRGVRYRHQTGGSQSEYRVLAHGKRNIGGWRQRTDQVARWWEQRHTMLRRYPVRRRVGQDLWVGQKVILTEPRALSSDGTYGLLAAVGIVTKVSIDEGAAATEPTHFLDILVNASSAAGIRFNAPSARGRGFDVATGRLYCFNDWAGVGNGYLDVAHFVEPGWSNLGGLFRIRVVQWNGSSWSETMTARVTGANAVADDCYLEVDDVVGTYRRDDDALVIGRAMDDQDGAWPQAFFSPICAPNGTWTGGTGYPFV